MTNPSPSQQLLRFFAYDHLPPVLQDISRPLAMLGADMDSQLPDGPEKTMGLRKLLEAKDCFVRAALPPAPEYPLISPGDAPVHSELAKDAPQHTHTEAVKCTLPCPAALTR